MQYLTLFVIYIIISNRLLAQDILKLNPSDTLPLDPNVKTGVLSNGFTYFIRNNENASTKLDVVFVVKAGRNQEDSRQTELAHLLEHLAFDATKHFRDPWAYFNKFSGVILNGSTAPEYTVYYILNIPSSNLELIDNAILYARDIAHDIQLDSINIENQRGVVTNEMRRMINAEHFMLDEYIDQQIGVPGFHKPKIKDSFRNIENFHQSSLLRFYNDWYWADNQAIIVVGDINVDDIERKIISLFSDLPKSPNPKERVICPAFKWKNQVIKVTHPEQQKLEVQVINKHPFHQKNTIKDYSLMVQAELFNIMINARLEEYKEQLSLSPTSILTEYNNYYNGYPLFGAFFYKFILNEDEIVESFKNRVIELERIRRFGFISKELESAKYEYSKRNLTVDKLKSNYSISTGYRDHFVYEEAYTGPENEETLLKQLLQETKLEQVNELAKDLISDEARDIVILAPERLKSALPSEETIMKLMNEIRKSNIQPYQEKLKKQGSIKDLMSKEEVAGLNTKLNYKQELIEAIDVTKISLANGTIILFKPVLGKGVEKDKIFIRGFSHGGASLYSKSDYPSAFKAPELVVNSGLGNLTSEELTAFKKESRIAIHAAITNNEEHIWGEVHKDRFDLFLQLMYKYFNSPEISEKSYKELINQFEDNAVSASGSTTSLSLIWDSLRNKLGFDPINTKVFNREDISKIDPNRALNIFKELFGNISDFSFVITGNFDLKESIPMVVKYLGALPSSKDGESRKQPKPLKIKKLSIQKKTYTGSNLRPARVTIFFGGNYKPGFANDLHLDQLGTALEVVLKHRLRQIEGGTYSLGASASKHKGSAYSISMSFTCEVEDIQRMISASLEEIENLKRFGVSDSVLKEIKASETDKMKTDFESYRFWMSYLSRQILIGGDLSSIKDRQLLLDQLDSNRIKKLAKMHLKKNCYFELIELPECLASSCL